jgi:hypothetical protein
VLEQERRQGLFPANPIKQLFAKLKALLRKGCHSNDQGLLGSCQRAAAFNPDQCANYFANAGYGVMVAHRESALGKPAGYQRCDILSAGPGIVLARGLWWLSIVGFTRGGGCGPFNFRFCWMLRKTVVPVVGPNDPGQ